MLGLPVGVRACLFDLDGVLTKTATVHASAWKQTLDTFLRRRAERTGESWVPFDAVADYDRFVDGKSQTRLPWDSWKKPYTMDEPTIWFHEVFRADGTPYRAAETDLIRRLAAAPKGVVPAAPAMPVAARAARR